MNAIAESRIASFPGSLYAGATRSTTSGAATISSTVTASRNSPATVMTRLV